MNSKTDHRQRSRPYNRTLLLVASRYTPQSFMAEVPSDYVQAVMPDRVCAECYARRGSACLAAILKRKSQEYRRRHQHRRRFTTGVHNSSHRGNRPKFPISRSFPPPLLRTGCSVAEKVLEDIRTGRISFACSQQHWLEQLPGSLC